MSRSVFRRSAPWLLTGGAMLVLASVAPAQGNSGKLQCKEADTNVQQRVRAMREGKGAINKDDLETLTKWLVYRMTYPKAADPSDTSPTDGLVIPPLPQLVAAAQGYILDYPTKAGQARLTDAQLAYQREFNRQMVERIGEVMKNRQQIVRASAARLLSHLARSGQEDLADVYVGILAKNDDPSGDGLKFFALQGLKTLLAIRPDADKPLNSIIKDPKRYKKTIVALGEFIFRKPNHTADTPPEEIEGFRYVRREAIRALAHIRQSVLRSGGNIDQSDGMKIQYEPGLVLLRVALRDGLLPEPSLSERTEAVIGFCNMDTDSELDVEYAVDVIGQFIRELALSRKSGAEVGIYPVKLDGARLSLALEAWKKESSTLPKVRNGARVAEFAERANEYVLSKMETGSANDLNPDGLQTWLSANRPKGTSLIRGHPETEIKSSRPPVFAPAETKEKGMP